MSHYHTKDEECKIEPVEKAKSKKTRDRKAAKEGRVTRHHDHSAGRDDGSKESGASHGQAQTVTRRALTVQDGTAAGLTGTAIYFIRTSTKRTLGYEGTHISVQYFPIMY